MIPRRRLTTALPSPVPAACYHPPPPPGVPPWDAEKEQRCSSESIVDLPVEGRSGDGSAGSPSSSCAWVEAYPKRSPGSWCGGGDRRGGSFVSAASSNRSNGTVRRRLLDVDLQPFARRRELLLRQDSSPSADATQPAAESCGSTNPLTRVEGVYRVVGVDISPLALPAGWAARPGRPGDRLRSSTGRGPVPGERRARSSSGPPRRWADPPPGRLARIVDALSLSRSADSSPRSTRDSARAP